MSETRDRLAELLAQPEVFESSELDAADWLLAHGVRVGPDEEFAELLTETVALREWKAAHEAAAFRSALPAEPSEAAVEAATQAFANVETERGRIGAILTEHFLRPGILPLLRAAYRAERGDTR